MLARLFSSRLTWLALAVLVIGATLPLYVTGYILAILTLSYYFGVFAMAWDLLFGFAGEVNFGPTFLIGTGAYTAGILDNLYQPPIWICVAAGALAAVAGGVVLALPALRVRGPYFGLTTLVAVLMLQNFVVGYLETLTAYLISPAYRTIPALLLLVIVMYIRPQGLLGRR